MLTIVCPVCSTKLKDNQVRPGGRDANYYNCPNCGEYLISRSILSNMDTLSARVRAVLSHGIWRGQKLDTPFLVTTNTLEGAQRDTLPDPAEQLDLLILWHGRKQESPGMGFSPNRQIIRAKVGAVHDDDISWLYNAAQDAELIIRDTSEARSVWRLSIKGWQRFHEIESGAIHSKTAFMAMPFRYENVTQMVDTVFRPAVAEAGFTLKRVNDEPRAGSIDDRIRVEIRLSRFVIADLTCGNQGAYWEAGYAEGLDKPVIYTCNKHYFESQGTHFDTNHHQTVLWDPADPARAAEDLKATIRATMPFEAVMPKE